MRLLGYLKLSGVLTCETGLLVGGSDTFGIGGIDKVMIRETFNGNRPYIPGSSLKGRMRNALEQAKGLLTDEGVHSCPNAGCPVCRVFGAGDAEDLKTITRLVVRDAKLIVDDADAPAHARAALAESEYCAGVQEYQRQTGGFVEVKTENVINRKTGTADKPRRFERVPAGMKFKIDLLYRVFDDQDTGNNRDLNFFAGVAQALDLVQQEYVGASGSRGYGRVQIDQLQLAFVDARERKSRWQGSAALTDWQPHPDLVKAVKDIHEANQAAGGTSGETVTATPAKEAENAG